MSDNLNTDLETQAKYIASLLDEHAQKLSMRQLKQLEDARNNAVNVHANAGINVNRDGSLTGWMSDNRLAMVGMLLGGVLIAMLAMQALNRNHEPSDAFLLSADLPPEAFVDRGFEPWLNAKLDVKAP
jgi:Protein of unknown function (DUF3619)